MKISELFYSIQGEGKRTGSPSFFIRTNFCNLRCMFAGGNLCDTSYTSWYPDDEKNIGEMSIQAVLNEYKKYNCRDIVISGGEPTMYPDELTVLCGEIKKLNKNIYITLETNGTNFDDFAERIDLISISPKLASSVPYNTEFEKMHEKNRINIPAFKRFNEIKAKSISDVQWKFVYTNENDIDEIKKLQEDVGFLNEDIYLMPEGITEEDLSKKRLQTIEACKQNRFNYTDRLHIIIWGNKRGT